MSPTRAAGALLFLFIPLVLVLFLRMPLGQPASILTGLVLMIAHPRFARPFMWRHLAERCFWCGRDLAAPGIPAPFRSGQRTVAAETCSRTHAARVTAFGRTMAAGRLAAFALIAIPVVVYLANALLTIVGWGFLPLDTARTMFKVPIALAVVTASFAWPLGFRLARDPTIDFPAHNLSLLGVGWTLQIFRIVGLWWLVDAAWRASG
jgi:hypothetical protein